MEILSAIIQMLGGLAMFLYGIEVMGDGLKNSSGNLEKPTSKASSYKLSASILKAFEEKNGATLCRDLKGRDTGKVLRSCSGCIEDAARIAEEILDLK